MKVRNQYFEILDRLNGKGILKKIEKCGRVCYKSENKIGDGTAEKFVGNIIKRGHESVLEHVSFSVRFVTDRAVTHELVRHRLASFSQESQRYVAYDGDMEFIRQVDMNTVSGEENIRYTFQAEWSQWIDVKGYELKASANPQSNPDETALATANNWQRWVADFRNGAGLMVKSLADLSKIQQIMNVKVIS